MAFRITASLTGTPIGEQITASRRDLAKAVSAAVAGATEGMKLELRRQLDRSGGRFSRFQKAIQSRVYPKPPTFSMAAAGTVFAAGDAAERAFSAFATGAVVTPTRARALAIPLHGFRGVDGKLLGPKSSYFAGRLHFIPARRGGPSVGILAMRGVGRPSAIRRQQRTKGRARAAQGLGAEWVPQFVLVRAAKLPQLLSPDEALAKWGGQVPNLISAALQVVQA